MRDMLMDFGWPNEKYIKQIYWKFMLAELWKPKRQSGTVPSSERITRRVYLLKWFDGRSPENLKYQHLRQYMHIFRKYINRSRCMCLWCCCVIVRKDQRTAAQLRWAVWHQKIDPLDKGTSPQYVCAVRKVTFGTTSPRCCAGYYTQTLRHQEGKHHWILSGADFFYDVTS